MGQQISLNGTVGPGVTQYVEEKMAVNTLTLINPDKPMTKTSCVHASQNLLPLFPSLSLMLTGAMHDSNATENPCYQADA